MIVKPSNNGLIGLLYNHCTTLDIQRQMLSVYEQRLTLLATCSFFTLLRRSADTKADVWHQINPRWKIIPVDIDRYVFKVNENEAVDLSTVWWIMRFSKNDRGMSVKLSSTQLSIHEMKGAMISSSGRWKMDRGDNILQTTKLSSLLWKNGSPPPEKILTSAACNVLHRR